MKRLLVVLLLIMFMLSGCSFPEKDSGENEKHRETTEATMEVMEEEPLPWVEAVAVPWDADGVLYEIPLDIPDAMRYSALMEFNGNLLLYGADYHLEGKVIMELCLFDLSDGRVTSRREVAMSEFTTPRAIGDRLYFCDSTAGYVEELDRKLNTVRTWNTEATPGNWYMGANEKLYIHTWEEELLVRDLATGNTVPVLEGNPGVGYMIADGDTAAIDYYLPSTGAPASAVLDFNTGEVFYAPENGEYVSVAYDDGSWLCGTYTNLYNYVYSKNGSEPVMIIPDGGVLDLLDGKYLSYSNEEGTVLSLYDLDGKFLYSCNLTAAPYSYNVTDYIWSDTYNGYFCPVNGYDSSYRLLFWELEEGGSGEDLVFQQIPEASEEEALLRQRARELGEKYGVTILVGNDCDTYFDEFSAEIITDYWRVNNALDTLDEAFSVYPEGFFRQLRYGSIYGIRIHLVTNLFADGSGRYGDGYIAFTQPQWDHYLMVVDIEDTNQETYYHEISHIIDSYLEWDSWEREDALYSEETWCSLNPSWFPGYSYDYSQEYALDDYTAFVDMYSTISPTEDRARVMEYAMAEWGAYTFEGADILLAKLAYYSRCIRDAFNTEGWPRNLPWEQYLS